MFEFSINKLELLPSLLMVAGAVDKKQAIPVLSNILIQVQPGVLILTASDLELEITARIACLNANSESETTVPTKKIIDVVRSLDEDKPLLCSFKDDFVSIKVGRSQFKLGTLPAATYPRCQEDANDLEWTIHRQTLIQLLQSTCFSMAQLDVRAYLNSLLLDFDGQAITAVATDGHRMAIAKHTTDVPKSQHRFLIPKKGVQELLKLLHAINDEKVLLMAGKNHLKIVTTQYTLMTKLVETRFPVYAKAIPLHQDKFVTIDGGSLKRAFARMMILAHEKSKVVVLQIQPGLLTLIANNQEQEEAIETLEAITEGLPLSIGLNAAYMLEVLNHLGEGALRMSFASEDSSILLTPQNDPHYQYIIMPMKL